VTDAGHGVRAGVADETKEQRMLVTTRPGRVEGYVASGPDGQGRVAAIRWRDGATGETRTIAIGQAARDALPPPGAEAVLVLDLEPCLEPAPAAGGLAAVQRERVTIVRVVAPPRAAIGGGLARSASGRPPRHRAPCRFGRRGAAW
jgi:hypothetical protein